MLELIGKKLDALFQTLSTKPKFRFVTHKWARDQLMKSSDYFWALLRYQIKTTYTITRAADLIVNIGHDVVEKPPFFMEHGGASVIYINYKSAQVDQVYFPQVEVIGDIALSMDALSDCFSLDTDFALDKFYQVRDLVRNMTTASLEEISFPPKPQHLVAQIRQSMGYHDIITLDNGVYKIWFARNYPAFQPNTILLDNALATMGAGLPSA